MNTHAPGISGVRAVALLVVTTIVTAAILLAVLVDTLTSVSLASSNASNPLHCDRALHAVHPEPLTLELVAHC